MADLILNATQILEGSTFPVQFTMTPEQVAPVVAQVMAMLGGGGSGGGSTDSGNTATTTPTSGPTLTAALAAALDEFRKVMGGPFPRVSVKVIFLDGGEQFFTYGFGWAAYLDWFWGRGLSLPVGPNRYTLARDFDRGGAPLSAITGDGFDVLKLDEPPPTLNYTLIQVS